MRNLKKVLSLSLALVMLLGMMVVGASAAVAGKYSDAADIQYVEAADVVDALGLVEGSGGNYNPKGTLTRGEAAVFITRLVLGPEVAKTLTATNSEFTDLTANWYKAAVAYCSSYGYIEGNGAGRFYPELNVTGFQFAKMLLVALGYDAEVEGYNGSGWRTNVAVDALSAGLTQGLVVSDAELTRDQAVKMMFNALTADMVQYTLKTDNFGLLQTVPNTKNDYRYYTLNSGVNSGSNTSTPTNRGDSTMQFCELHFPNLKLTEDDVDVFGNIVARWKIVTGNTATTISEAEVSYAQQYTALTTAGKIYSDLGMTGPHTADYFVDGVQSTVTISAGSSLKVGGNGAVTTVWINEKGDPARITVVNTYVGDIAGVSADGKTVTVAPRLTTEPVRTFATTGLAVGDAVLYTQAYESKAIQSVEKVEPITATLNGFTQRGILNGNATLNAETSEYSEKIAQEAEAGSLRKTVTAIKDKYGYVIWVSNTVAVPNYAYVIAHYADPLDSSRNQARMVLANGSIVTWYVNIAQGTTDLKDHLVSYAYNPLTGVYDITDGMAAQATAQNQNMTTKGNPTVMVHNGTNNTTAGLGTNSTVFIVQMGLDQFEVYQGIANVPTMVALTTDAKSASIRTGNVINAVYVDARANTTTGAPNVSFSGNATDVVFILNNYGYQGTDASGAYGLYTAIRNGQIDAAFKANRGLETGLYTYVKYNENTQTYTVANQVTSANIGAAAGVTTGTAKLANGALNLGGIGYTYDASTAVFVVENNAIRVFNVANVGNDSNDIVYQANVGGKLALLVIVKVAGGENGAPVVTPDGQTTTNSTTGLSSLSGTYASLSSAKHEMKVGCVYKFPAGSMPAGAGTTSGAVENLLYIPFDATSGQQVNLEISGAYGVYTETVTAPSTGRFAFSADTACTDFSAHAADGQKWTKTSGSYTAGTSQAWPSGDYTWVVYVAGVKVANGTVTVTTGYSEP